MGSGGSSCIIKAAWRSILCSTLLHWQYGTVLSEFHCTHYSWQPIWEGWGYHWVKDMVLTALSIATPCLKVFWKAVKTTEDHGDHNRHVYLSVKATHFLLSVKYPQRFTRIAFPRRMFHYHAQNRAIKMTFGTRALLLYSCWVFIQVEYYTFAVQKDLSFGFTLPILVVGWMLVSAQCTQEIYTVLLKLH